MHCIKVRTTPSTNVYLRQLFKDSILNENTYVIAEEQTHGRGQMGAGWSSEKGKNLTLSLLIKDLNLPLEEQFKLSALTALAIAKHLKKWQIPKVVIKWPNDILAENLKVCGILIENILINGKLGASIIGLGLNVNQTDFQELRQATSLKLLTGKTFNLDELAKGLVEAVEEEIYSKKDRSIEAILAEYYQHLFRLEKPSTFEFPDGSRKAGIIKGVNPDGRLKIWFENNQLNHFEIKEIKLLY